MPGAGAEHSGQARSTLHEGRARLRARGRRRRACAAPCGAHGAAEGLGGSGCGRGARCREPGALRLRALCGPRAPAGWPGSAAPQGPNAGGCGSSSIAARCTGGVRGPGAPRASAGQPALRGCWRFAPAAWEHLRVRPGWRRAWGDPPARAAAHRLLRPPLRVGLRGQHRGPAGPRAGRGQGRAQGQEPDAGPEPGQARAQEQEQGCRRAAREGLRGRLGAEPRGDRAEAHPGALRQAMGLPSRGRVAALLCRLSATTVLARGVPGVLRSNPRWRRVDAARRPWRCIAAKDLLDGVGRVHVHVPLRGDRGDSAGIPPLDV
mmetsp:Transcript_25394/g.73231  ORF Transcript_25394/g.73231 Transcript_25394/m.73231 type:complete len:320 (-) Transcript_25394:508-1467(-)